MTLIEFNQFLLRNSHVTGRVVSNVFENKPSSIKPFFFQRYQSTSDPFYRASSIVSAPICLAVVAVEFAGASILYAIKSALDLATLNPGQAKENGGGAIKLLMAMTAALCIAILSPLINALDLIGGGVNTLLSPDSHVGNYSTLSF
ncbi:hypothetical protein [Legionella maioricensis]|uniref:Uncharacterized protein n=1 Tax=Legionella maioricensis TaxID=2896528 RepID=A0A9X2IAA0_9GAMM|nr:hypothetical protein [Legionella maioricensis]MCL9683854.1 hypothetical protein [Legionella maioricensis]MCL9686701.1 hypothetical protein [Legionella maioricensis]